MSESEAEVKPSMELPKVNVSSSFTKSDSHSKENDLTEPKRESTTKAIIASQTSYNTTSKIRNLGGSRNRMTKTLSVEFSDVKIIAESGAKILTTSTYKIKPEAEPYAKADSLLMEKTDFDKPRFGSITEDVLDSKINVLSTSTIELITSMTKNPTLSGSRLSYLSPTRGMTDSSIGHMNVIRPWVAIRAKVNKKKAKSKKHSKERRKGRSDSKGKEGHDRKSRRSVDSKSRKQPDPKGKTTAELKNVKPTDIKPKKTTAVETNKLVEKKVGRTKLADSDKKTPGAKAKETPATPEQKTDQKATDNVLEVVKEVPSSWGLSENSNDSFFAVSTVPSSSESSSSEDDEILMVKQNARPFNVGERRFEGKISQVPGPGTYSIDGTRKRMEFNYSFNGAKTMVPAVEIKCTENNMDKCKVCGKIPYGDYWHFKHIEFMCRECMENVSSRKMHPTQRLKIEAFRKIRDCSEIHRHEGTRAKIMLADERQIKKLQVKEAYLSQYY